MAFSYLIVDSTLNIKFFGNEPDRYRLFDELVEWGNKVYFASPSAFKQFSMYGVSILIELKLSCYHSRNSFNFMQLLEAVKLLKVISIICLTRSLLKSNLFPISSKVWSCSFPIPKRSLMISRFTEVKSDNSSSIA